MGPGAMKPTPTLYPIDMVFPGPRVPVSPLCVSGL